MAARENFGSQVTAVLAMAGSAIGLGNIWRFPYMVGQNGGAVFIIVYLIAAILLCIPIFLSETLIGKRTQLSTIGAFERLAPGSAWKWVGIFTVFTPLIILSYYSVVGGWSIEYLLKSLTLSFSDPALSQQDHSRIFTDFVSSDFQPLIFFSIFMLINTVIVIGGVKSGIERFTKFTTPLLFVLVVVIMGYSLSLPGSAAGIRYMLRPDWSALTPRMMLSALGQAFFSLSLGVGCILTYGSYLKREDNIVGISILTVIFDLVFAMMAGFAVMPAVFAAGIEPGAGPGLIFETLPFIFSSIGAKAPALSAIIAILFFVTILCAALTSSISMLEVGVAYLVDVRKWTRRRAVLILALGCWMLGALCSLSFGSLSGVRVLGSSIFDFCDFLTSDFLMTFGSLLFVLFVGYRMDRQEVYDAFTNGGTTNTRLFGIFYSLVRYLAPVVIAIVFLSTLFMH